MEIKGFLGEREVKIMEVATLELGAAISTRQTLPWYHRGW
jgi:hypothetical protein